MTLSPAEDIKIDIHNLHVEAGKISHLLYLYDTEWGRYNKIVNKLEAQVKNIEDSLKILRLQLFAKAKAEHEKITDKAAEALYSLNKEYLELFGELKAKREEYADAKSNADLYQNFHYQLLDKSKSVDLLFRMHNAQYFTTDRSNDSGDSSEQNKTWRVKPDDTTNVTNELTNKLKRKSIRNAS